jgi:hypothetical protein
MDAKISVKNISSPQKAPFCTLRRDDLRFFAAFVVEVCTFHAFCQQTQAA